MSPDLSIVIVNYRGWRRLEVCLDGLFGMGDTAFSWESVVVDNHSNDGQLSEFRRRYPQCDFCESAINGGFAHGCNMGAERASGRFLLFLNPDTVVDAAALKSLLTLAEAHPDYTALSCAQRDDRGRDTKPFGAFPSVANLTGIHRALQRWFCQGGVAGCWRMSDGPLIFPDWVSGSLLMMRRADFDRLRGWCEDFWLYFEDVDLCRRVQDSGGRVVLARDIVIRHNHGGATRLNPRVKALTKWEVRISRHVYIQKHLRGWDRLHAQALLVGVSVTGHLLMGGLGVMLAFLPAMRLRVRICGHMLRYYTGALRRRSWLSPRAPGATQPAAAD